MYSLSDTLTFPIGNVRINPQLHNNLIVATNDFYCSGVVGYTAYLAGSVNKYATKLALEREPKIEVIDYRKDNSITKKSVTGDKWAEAIEYKEEDAFALCLPKSPNKYAAQKEDYFTLIEHINNTLGESYHSVLLSRFMIAYPDKRDRVVCLLPKSMIRLTSLGSFNGSPKDYADVKELVCALSYIAAGTDMTHKYAMSFSAGNLLIDWKINKDDELPNYIGVKAHLRSSEYIENAMSRIINEYTGVVKLDEIAKYDTSIYRGAAVSNFSLGINPEHINFNDFSFLNALSIIKQWEERRGINLQLDSLEEDYYEARLKAPYVPDPF